MKKLLTAIIVVLVLAVLACLPDAEPELVEHDYGPMVEVEVETPALPLSTPVVTETEADILPDHDEDELITEALLRQGYLREDVPLSFELQDTLHTACEEFGVPYELMLGLVEVESNFNTDAVSPHGAEGLCQLMPSWFGSGLTPAENIRAGTEYLAEMHDRYGYWEAALCGYNRGKDTGEREYSSKVVRAAVKWGWVYA